MDDHQAIQRLKRDDISGLQALVERYQVKVTRTAYLITHDVALADDVMQAAFLRVYKSIQTFDQNRPFEPWLMRIVVNLALKNLKAEPDVIHEEDMDALASDPDGDPELAVQDHELADMVRAALEQLSPQQRAVIVLYYYLDHTEGDIAKALNRPLGTVRWQLYAAKKQLRRLLSREVKP